MPSTIIHAPVGATNMKLVNRGRSIPIDPFTICFNRVGEDGTLQIIPIFAGTEYVGEVLDGEFIKGWDANMDADQAFTAILDGSGVLQFQGEADVAGVDGTGWINCKNGIPLMHELGITVSLELPVDTSGAVANRDLGFDFFLRKDKTFTVPDVDDNYLAIRNYVPEYVAGSTPVYTEVDESIDVSGFGVGWNNVDIFTLHSIPKSALVQVDARNMRDAASAILGVRTDGSALVRSHNLDDANGAQGGNGVTFRVKCHTTTGIIECYDDAVDADYEYKIIGYWEDVDFEEAWTTFSPVGLGAWETLTVDASYIDRVASFHWTQNHTFTTSIGMRRKGSIINRRLISVDDADNSNSVVAFEACVKLDASGQVEIFTTSLLTTFILEGYFDVNMDYAESFTDRTQAATGWVNKDLTGIAVTGDILELILLYKGSASAAGFRGARVDGSAIDRRVDVRVPISATGRVGTTFTSEVGAANVLETYQESAANDHCWIMGTFIPSAVAASGGMYIKVEQSVNDAVTTLHNSPNYIDGENPAIGDLEGQIWKFLFHDGDPSETGVQADRHVHLYLKQAATIADAEYATEYELTSSPYDISDYIFDWAYPAYELRSENTTYFDSTSEAKTEYLRVDIPSFRLAHDPPTNADRMKNEAELWDGEPDVAGSKKVYDVDHAFSGVPYIKNGLLKARFNQTYNGGIVIASYYSGAFTDVIDIFRFTLRVQAQLCTYPLVKKIVSITPEKVVLNVRFRDDDVDDDDFFVDCLVTLKRGSYVLQIEPVEAYPSDDLTIATYKSGQRWGYSGNGKIADDDLDLTGDNTTLSDNFLLGFDDDGSIVVYNLSTNKKPIAGNAWFRVYRGGNLYFESIAEREIGSHIIYLAVAPFALIANLFKEAEDGSYGTAGTVTDVLASPLAGANNAVQLNAIGDYKTPAGEYSVYAFTAGTHLPAGRYLAVVRAKYVDEETMNMYVWNNADDEYRNEENAETTKTLTSDWAYYSLVFDITDTDVTGTDAFAIVAEKSTDDTDEIRTDYVLIVPIGDGESFPQDLAHSALRPLQQEKRLLLR